MDDLALAGQVPLLPVRAVARGDVHVGVVLGVVAVAVHVQAHRGQGAAQQQTGRYYHLGDGQWSPVYLGRGAGRVLRGGRGRRVRGVGLGLVAEEAVYHVLQRVPRPVHLAPVVVPGPVQNQPLREVRDDHWSWPGPSPRPAHLLVGVAGVVLPVVVAPVPDPVAAAHPRALREHALVRAADSSGGMTRVTQHDVTRHT